LSLRRILNLAAALAAVAAAAVVTVVAAAFALYALARIWLTQAGAAAVVAAAFALVALITAWLATRKVPKEQAPQEDASLVDRAIRMAQERPLIALGAAAAAGVVLIRNPSLVTAVVSAFLAGNASKTES
jgi:hypothetical protein